MENRITHIICMHTLRINASAYYAGFTKALWSRYTAEAMQSSPHYCQGPFTLTQNDHFGRQKHQIRTTNKLGLQCTQNNYLQKHQT